MNRNFFAIGLVVGVALAGATPVVRAADPPVAKAAGPAINS